MHVSIHIAFLSLSAQLHGEIHQQETDDTGDREGVRHQRQCAKIHQHTLRDHRAGGNGSGTSISRSPGKSRRPMLVKPRARERRSRAGYNARDYPSRAFQAPRRSKTSRSAAETAAFFSRRISRKTDGSRPAARGKRTPY